MARQGATSINEIVQFDMLDDLIASLHLKPIPSKKLRARLQPTQSLATALSPGQEAASPADGAGGWLADAGESIKGMLQRLDTSTRLLLKTENAMEADGFAVRPLLRKQADDARVLASLEALLIPKVWPRRSSGLEDGSARLSGPRRAVPSPAVHLASHIVLSSQPDAVPASSSSRL